MNIKNNSEALILLHLGIRYYRSISWIFFAIRKEESKGNKRTKFADVPQSAENLFHLKQKKQNTEYNKSIPEESWHST